MRNKPAVLLHFAKINKMSHLLELCQDREITVWPELRQHLLNFNRGQIMDL